MVKEHQSLSVNKNRLLGLLILGFVALLPLVFSSVEPLHLLAAYPGFPKWALDAIVWASNAATAISLIGWVVGAGLATVAFNYLKKYGVRAGISL